MQCAHILCKTKREHTKTNFDSINTNAPMPAMSDNHNKPIN